MVQASSPVEPISQQDLFLDVHQIGAIQALDFAQMPEIIGWLERHWVEIGLTDPI